ncbi:MAG: hypothetical protein KF819_16510 [Labilithrix sp.]|nr:hypothetical protein [Labilithrix sp.]
MREVRTHGLKGSLRSNGRRTAAAKQDLPMNEVSTGPYPNRRIRVGVYVAAYEAIVAEYVFAPGADVTLGADDTAALRVRGWSGASIRLIERGLLLHFSPGMRLIMCDEAGGRRVTGTFEELRDQGMLFPMTITVSRLNVRVRDGISVFIEFEPPERLVPPASPDP